MEEILNHQLQFHVDVKVEELYSILHHDEASNKLVATITVERRREPTSTYHQFDIDVIQTIRRIFKLPYGGELFYIELDTLFVEEVMRRMMEDGTPSNQC